jgi:hypothetical protein
MLGIGKDETEGCKEVVVLELLTVVNPHHGGASQADPHGMTPILGIDLAKAISIKRGSRRVPVGQS